MVIVLTMAQVGLTNISPYDMVSDLLEWVSVLSGVGRSTIVASKSTMHGFVNTDTSYQTGIDSFVVSLEKLASTLSKRLAQQPLRRGSHMLVKEEYLMFGNAFYKLATELQYMASTYSSFLVKNRTKKDSQRDIDNIATLEYIASKLTLFGTIFDKHATNYQCQVNSQVLARVSMLVKKCMTTCNN